MDINISPLPLPYNSSYEHSEKDNAEVIAELLETMANIREKTFKDTGHAMRSVHAKSHGLLKGELKVVENLPPVYAQGLFAIASTYPLVIRLSTTPGDMLPDSVSTPKGCSIKVVSVPGSRLPGFETDTTQDFVMIAGGPTFQTADLKGFVASLKLLGTTADKAPGLKVAASTVLRGIESVIEKLGGESAALKNLGGEPEHHILGETFYTQTPFLFGPYMAKFSLVPVSEALTALTGTTLHAGDNPNAIREAVSAYFKEHSGVWELRAQLCIDIRKMPLEDATAAWPEDQSPYVTVARITLPPQPAWNETLSKAIDDEMSFSPWHCLAAHRPLGSINRARKPAYAQSAAFRMLHNGKGEDEPTNLEHVEG